MEDQVSTALEPSVMEVGLTEKLTVGAGGLIVSIVDALPLPPGPAQVKLYVAVPTAVGVTG